MKINNKNFQTIWYAKDENAVKIINQNKLYSYLSKTNTINVLDDEIIRIAKGSNLNKPETQFQFHNVLNKKGFFKQIENDQIKKGATIKLENIELEYK